MSAQVAADLRAAADVLERDGWTQGKYHRRTDRGFSHCAQGAIAAAVGRGPRPTPAVLRPDGLARWVAANRQLTDHLNCRALGSDAWNDQPGRTAAEVIAALRAAANKAEAGS